MAKILIVEDDPNINAAFKLALSQRGPQVEGCFWGAEGVIAARSQNPPELIVLDLMLPDLDGFSVCRAIRQTSLVPIIMMTARSDDADIVVGLEAGADDYVVKPVDPAILDARILAVLRRNNFEGEAADKADVVINGALRIDRSALSVSKNNAPLPLSPTEIRLLLELLQHPGQVRSREQLLRSVWGAEYLLDSRMVDASIQRLRSKNEDDPSNPQIVVTVRGFGYRFDQQK